MPILPATGLLFILGAAVLLGGASAAASIHGFALQILCLPFLAYALFRFRWGGVAADLPALSLVLLFIMAVAVQTIPVPEGIWTGFPGRALVASGFDQLGLGPKWLPVSLDASGTMAAFTAIVVPATLVLLAARLPDLPAAKVGLAVCALAILSLLIGAYQVRAGSDSSSYIHAYTNWGLAVGFFANANHLATLLLVSLPLAAALVAGLKDRRMTLTVRTVILAGYSLCTAGGIYLTSSNAGLALWLPVTGASFLLLLPRLRPSVAGAFGLGFMAISIVALVAWQSGAMPMVLKENLSDLSGSRLTMAQTTWAAAGNFWPVGSGLGTFEQIYPLFEKSAGVSDRYANHAHNDYLELLLELGLAGALLIAGALAWWATRTVQAWRRQDPGSLWPRAASVVLAILIVHSLVDYPLRTPALLAIAAFFALILAAAPKGVAAPEAIPARA